MKLIVALWLALSLPACASEVVQVSGKLSDEDFHMAVACAAPSGGACTKDLVHRSKSEAAKLTIGVDAKSLAANQGMSARAEQAVSRAATVLNAAGSGLHLVVVRGGKPKILVTIPSDASIAMLGTLYADGSPTSSPESTSWSLVSWNNAKRITRAKIVLSEHAPSSQIDTDILVQTLRAVGLLHALDGSPYSGSSLFSIRKNTAARLAGQDLVAVQLHCPAR